LPYFLNAQNLSSQDDLLNAPFDPSQESKNFSWQKARKLFGITYFCYFYGPGVISKTFSYSPNQLGLADDGGIRLQSQISFKYKFSSRLALDLQMKNKILLYNYDENLKNYRYEGTRIGISGLLLRGKDWDLSGALNTDFPYFFPDFFSGFQSQARKIILDPGMFGSFKYEPSGSRWFVFSVLAPRVYFYQNLDASESHFQKGGFSAKNKPELVIAIYPTINYRLTSQVSLTFGTSFDYRKQVYSNWNIFHGSLDANGDSSAWRLSAVSVSLGVTYAITSECMLVPHITTYPIAAQRINRDWSAADFGRMATLGEVTSFGMWIRGNLF
jgi:hypothetical protein